MSRSAAFLASLLASLGHPAWWLLALTGFLVRGGIILAILPLVILPSPLILSNLIGPLVLPLALGRVDGVIVATVVAIAGAALVWLIVGGLIGAATDLALIRDGAAAAADEGLSGGRRESVGGLPDARRGGIRVVARILAVRLVAHLPTVAVLMVGAVGIVDVTYGELTRPGDAATPLVFRVAVAAARPIIAIVFVWFLGELVGGMAARRIVLDGNGIRAALAGGLASVVRRPGSTVLPAMVTTIVLAIVLLGTLLGSRIAWLRADAAISDPSIDGTLLIATLLTFVAIWLAALTLIGVLTAARSVALTFETVRGGAERHASAATRGEPGEPPDGTFGASTHHRPGDRPIGNGGGSL